ncbi:MAG: SDR family oxidoreductase [Ketobacteraceae bacterium]|nr:SDR family oxidoreductase [Ketobacteraceae bacterium]
MKYVLVTGASAGIGEEFARQLAGAGESLILVARREERLQALATELQDAHGVSVQTVALDLSRPDAGETLAEKIIQEAWQLKGLINNAGFGDRGKFTELPLERQLNMIQVNVTVLVDLTHRLLPLLQASGDGFIINVASTASFQAGPNMAIYYATKAFVLSFSEALHEELSGRVQVSALCPGATDSEFAREANMSDTLLFKAGTMSSQAVVKKALQQRRRAIVIPGFKNWFGALLAKLSPRFITRKMAGMLQA